MQNISSKIDLGKLNEKKVDNKHKLWYTVKTLWNKNIELLIICIGKLNKWDELNPAEISVHQGTKTEIPAEFGSSQNKCFVYFNIIVAL